MGKLFGQKKPEELAKEWRSKLRTETRQIDRQIRRIQMEETKIKRSVKEAAKKGDQTVVRMLAKELVSSRRAVARLHKAKAQLNSVQLQLQQQVQQAKVMGALQKSTEVMTYMNNLMKMPEIAATMRTMAREMEKAGMLEEMTEDILEDALEIEDEEEEVEEAVDQVLDEVLGSKLRSAMVGSGDLRVESEAEVEVEEDEEEEELANRLNALRE